MTRVSAAVVVCFHVCTSGTWTHALRKRVEKQWRLSTRDVWYRRNQSGRTGNIARWVNGGNRSQEPEANTWKSNKWIIKIPKHKRGFQVSSTYASVFTRGQHENPETAFFFFFFAEKRMWYLRTGENMVIYTGITHFLFGHARQLLG